MNKKQFSWWKLLKKDIHYNVYAHNFGLIVPCPSGFYWEQQTEGVMCCHPEIEGIFIPLSEPIEICKKIQAANYYNKPATVKQGWKELTVHLIDHEGLEYIEVDAPEGEPKNQEGLQWIKIIKWDKKYFSIPELEGEVVALIYPNSD